MAPKPSSSMLMAPGAPGAAEASFPGREPPRAAEQERPGRWIEPLEEDFGAWLDFFRAWSAAPDPRAKLAELGLLPADVMRLQARWSARMSSDGGLLATASERLAGPPREMPVLIVHTAEREPSPAGAGEGSPGKPRKAGSFATVELSLSLLPQIATLPFARFMDEGSNRPARAESPPGGKARKAGSFDTVEPQLSPLPQPATLPFARPMAEGSNRTAGSPAAPPPDMPPSMAAPSLTLPQYASLCAELAVFAGQAEQVFARYGLHDQQHRMAVDRFFLDRLRRDPQEHAAWQKLYTRYQAHWTAALRRQGGPAA